MSIEFKLPSLGDGIEGGDVVSLLVAPGDEVQAEQDALEIETDKAVTAVPCPHAGKVEKILVEPGQRIAVGDVIFTLSEAAGGASAPAASEADSAEEASPPAASAPAAEAAPAPAAAPAPVAEAPRAAVAPAAVAPTETATNGDRRAPAPAGPATRRLARELGVDLYQVSGKGPGGRISREDVKAWVKGSLTSGGGAVAAGDAPLPDFSQWGEVEKKPLTGVRRATAEHMAKAWRTVPHVTQFDEANISRLESARQRHGRLVEKARKKGKEIPKITVTVLALKALAAALKRFPQFNASIDTHSGEIIYKKYYHLGVAVDTEHGLMVPVIRDVDQKTVNELSVELTEIAGRARARKLELAEMRGGTFTITNLGGIGGTQFTPIVNHPEVAILGLSRSQQVTVLEDGKVRNELRLPLSLSYDHRLIDGADGARFLRFVAELLEEPFQLIIEI